MSSEEEKWRAQLHQGLEQLELKLDKQQQDTLLAFMQILMKWNRAYNLTAIDEPYRIITHHILDSLSIVPYLKGERIIDIGSGAGLPGIPCAVALPKKQFVLLDSNGKKTRFMTQVVAELRLKNAHVVQDRVENYSVQQRFDVITARAFSSLSTICALTKHLINPQGEILVMKGVYPEAELQKIGNHAKVYTLTVPGLNEQRHLVSIKGLADE